MHIVLRNIKLKKTKYGYDLVIKMVRKFDSSHNFVENLKLDDETRDLLLNGKIVLNKRKRRRVNKR